MPVEVEELELELVLNHYAITWGIKTPQCPATEDNADGRERWAYSLPVNGLGKRWVMTSDVFLGY